MDTAACSPGDARRGTTGSRTIRDRSAPVPALGRRRGDAGTGLVTAPVTLLVVLLFLAWSAHLLVAAYATSTVMAVSTDAARQVASDRVDHRSSPALARAEADAERDARAQLGDLSAQVTFSWTTTADAVRLEVVLDQPWRLGPGWQPVRAFAHVDRTIVVPLEEPR
jgi:hypothetical protein